MALHSLLGTLYKLSIDFVSVSERLSGSFFIRLLARPYQEIETVCFLPKRKLSIVNFQLSINKVSRFLYYFFLCLCKSFKELSFLCPAPFFSAKAGAKVRLIFHSTKLFERKNCLKYKKSASLDSHQPPSSYIPIIYNIESSAAIPSTLVTTGYIFLHPRRK